MYLIAVVVVCEVSPVQNKTRLLSCVLDAVWLLVSLCRAGLADGPLVVLGDVVVLVSTVSRAGPHNLGHDRLLDALQVLALLELHLVLLAELDVRPGQSGAEAAGVRGPGAALASGAGS